MTVFGAGHLGAREITKQKQKTSYPTASLSIIVYQASTQKCVLQVDVSMGKVDAILKIWTWVVYILIFGGYITASA